MTIINVLPRIVCSRGVIMPEELANIDLKYGLFQTHEAVKENVHHYIETNFRYDRPTGMRDKAGKMIYERDMFKDKFGVDFIVRWDEENGGWIGESDSHIIHLYRGIDAGYITEVTGMVPWEAR